MPGVKTGVRVRSHAKNQTGVRDVTWVKKPESIIGVKAREQEQDEATGTSNRDQARKQELRSLSSRSTD